MAESKRIFNQGKQNRDIDARLLPPGQYRDALNVNVGESEGGDIGALENVKGNSLVQGQTGIAGTTIGVVKDPNNDNVYWFNTGTTNAIYEYNQSENRVRTILSDKASRTAPEPTCAPDTVASITTPDGNAPTRPTLPTIPDPPVAYCGAPSATNTGMTAVPSAADLDYDYVDNTICTFTPSFNCDGDGTASCSDPGNGTGMFSSQATCEATAPCAAAPPPVGAARSIVISGCPAGSQTTGTMVELTATAANFTGISPASPITVTVTGYTGTPITIDSGSGSATFMVTSAADANVVYTPSGSAAGQSSVINTPCSISWGTAVAPVTTFACTAFVNPVTNDNCFPDLTGQAPHATAAACAAICNPTPTNTCANYTFGGDAFQQRTEYFNCNQSQAPACQLTGGNVVSGMTVCVLENISTICTSTLNDPEPGANPTDANPVRIIAGGSTITATATRGATCS